MESTTTLSITGAPVTNGPGMGSAASRRQTLHIKRWVALYGLCQGRAYE